MARYKNGINGAFSGKIGNVVGATCRGIDYLRSLPETTKKPTQKQINQRLKFALVMGWLRPVLELINVGYQFFKGSKTPMNGAVSFHLKEAVIGEGPDYSIDFTKAIFSRGELLVSWILEVLSSVNAVLNIKWDNGSLSVMSKDDDKASFIVYNPVKEKYVIFRNVTERADKEVQLKLPKNFTGDAVHLWMQYVNATGDAVSTTVYVGLFLLL